MKQVVLNKSGEVMLVDVPAPRPRPGFVHVRTIQGWPPGPEYPTVFLALFEKK